MLTYLLADFWAGGHLDPAYRDRRGRSRRHHVGHICPFDLRPLCLLHWPRLRHSLPATPLRPLHPNDQLIRFPRRVPVRGILPSDRRRTVVKRTCFARLWFRLQDFEYVHQSCVHRHGVLPCQRHLPVRVVVAARRCLQMFHFHRRSCWQPGR